jgi:hypothetical protein
MNFLKVNQKLLASAFGVSVRTVQRWDLPRNPDGSYNLGECIQAKIEEMQHDMGDMPPDSKESLRWLGKYREERFRICKLEREELEGKLVRVSKVKGDLFAAGSMIKHSLYSLPERWAPILAAESDTFKIKQLMRREINNILDELVQNLGRIP